MFSNYFSKNTITFPMQNLNLNSSKENSIIHKGIYN